MEDTMQRNVILYIAMSLDGYIAHTNGDVSWLCGEDENSPETGNYAQFIENIDTVILGYTTYHQIITELSPTHWVYSTMKSYVLTHKKEKSTDEIIFTNQNIKDLILQLKAEQGKDIWICGGANIANQLIKLNLIDRYHIAVIPTILGSGIRLFASDYAGIKLNLVSTENYNGITELVYERKK